MIKYDIIKIDSYIPTEITCDLCKVSFDYETDIFEVQEFIKISIAGGYGSIFGDGVSLNCDLCQHCIKVLVGDILIETL